MIEVLVASGLVAVVVLGLTTSMNFSQRAARSIATTTDFTSLVATVQAVLNSAPNCAKALENHTLTPPSVPGDLSPAQPVSPLRTQGGAVIVQLGRMGNSLDVTQLAFVSAVPLTAANQYLARLRLGANKIVGGGAVGGQSLVHDYDVSVQIDPGNGNRIVACTALTDNIWTRAANGVDIFYSVGNVGIGTATPAANLHVAGASAVQRIDSTTAGQGSWLQLSNSADNTGIALGRDGAGNFELNYDSPIGTGNRLMTVTTGGNVGIGNNNPAARLEVAGGIRPGNQAQVGACDAANEGVMRYNTGTHAMEYCGGNPLQWKSAGGGSLSACQLEYRFFRNGVSGPWQSVALNGTSNAGGNSSWSVTNLTDECKSAGCGIQMRMNCP